jgi:phage tail sheath protein FI
MPLQIGVNVLEVDGPATPTLQAAPTSVAAFVGRTRRGVPHQAVRVTDPSQFLTRSGAPRPDAYTGLAVLGFFLNGGRETYVVRVVGAGSAAASRSLTSRRSPAADSLRLRAGYRGAEDPGAWGNALRVDVRDDPQASATVTSAVAATDTGAVLGSLSGIAVGSVLALPTSGGISFRTITGMDAVASRVTWDSALGATVAQDAVVTTAEFRLVIRLQDEATGAFPVVEDWRWLSMQPGTPGYVVDRLNHPATGSRFVTVADLDHGVHAGVNLPAIASGVALVNGSETAPTVADLVGSPGDGTGLHALDTVQPQLLAVPDAHLLDAGAARTVAQGAIAYCAGRGDCMYVGAPPDREAGTVSRYAESIKTYAAGGLQGRNVYGALYAPWIVVPDVAASGPNPVRPIPPDGHVLGIYARTELERGIFKAPAGDAAVVLGANSLRADFSDGEHTDLVQNGHVNGIRAVPGSGIVVAASRTLSTDPRWLFVNVRLLFNFVKASLRDGLRFVRQEPNTDTLRRSVAFNVVTPFLLGLWQRGAFGSDPPAAVFTVKCDAENNPPAQVDLGNFQLEVYFYPARPAETVQIIVGQLPSGGTAAEA